MSQNKKWKKIDPHYFLIWGTRWALFSSIFPFDALFGHKWHLKIEPPTFQPKISNLDPETLIPKLGTWN